MRKLLCVELALATLLATAACGKGEKDEWNGEKITNYALSQTVQVQSGLENPPTVVCDLVSQTAYEALTTTAQKPSNVILRLNKFFNVVDAQGKKLCSFSSLYNDTLRDKIIPIIYVPDEEGVQIATELFTKRYDILDAAVMSDNPEYVKAVRQACPRIRGAVEFHSLEDPYDAVRLTNASRASVAVIPQEEATAETVFYIQARFRTVWVRPNSVDRGNVYESVNSGASGIVAEDYKSVVKTLGNYEDHAITRMPFVVAHRGLPNDYNENSVSGAQAAIKAGASHIEFDGYLTTDNRIAMMHDSKIDRTSSGTGEIEKFSLEELQKFQLDVCEPFEPIPSLDDIFLAMKDTEIVLLFEIKSTNVEIVNALKTALETHHMERQVVVITFHMNILKAMQSVLPEIPTASLSGLAGDNMADAIAMFAVLNTGISAAYPDVTPAKNAMMRDRGVIGWCWTYNTVAQMRQAMASGYLGLTTNVADKFLNNSSTKYLFVKGDSSVTVVPEIGQEIGLVGVTYKKTEEKIKGKVFYTEDLGDKYAVIATYATAGGGTDSPLFYTQTFYVPKDN